MEQNPDYKKQRKEIQTQRYELYEQERLNNIERCKAKRKEIITHSKKVIKPTKLEEELEDEVNYNENDNFYKIRNSEDNYVLRGNLSAKKKKQNEIYENNKNQILVTEGAYIMRNSVGEKAKINKKELEEVTCLNDEKKRLMEKAKKKDGQLMRYLKVEIDREKKIKQLKDVQKLKQKNLKKFMKVKNKELKQMENDRYKDNQNVYERQKLVQKLFSSYDPENANPKLNVSNSDPNKKKLAKDKSKSKIDTLNEQIKEYEKKNQEYKEKITNMFELKDKEEIDKLLKERKEKMKSEDNSKKIKSVELIKQKLSNLEEKFEIEKYRREMALMKNMNTFQDKINKYLIYKETKEAKIKNTMLKNEQDREKKIDKRNIILEKTKENKINKQKENEEKRNNLIKSIEKNELKNYAIREEKKKLNEERRMMNKLNDEEREEMKIKIQKILNKQKEEDDKDEKEDKKDKKDRKDKNDDILNEKSEDIIKRLMDENTGIKNKA